MKVIGIAGSLRAKSNTLQYVKNALHVLDDKEFETELISLRGKEIKLLERRHGRCRPRPDGR